MPDFAKTSFFDFFLENFHISHKIDLKQNIIEYVCTYLTLTIHVTANTDQIQLKCRAEFLGLPRMPSMLWLVRPSSPEVQSSDTWPPRRTREMLDTLGALFLSQTDSCSDHKYK